MQCNNIIFPFSASWQDYPDNESIAILIYFVQCEHNCIQCHNPKFQNLKIVAAPFSLHEFNSAIKGYCRSYKTNKVVFSGGDPLHLENRMFVKEFLELYGNDFDICIYTGYSIEEVQQMKITNFKYIKVNKYDVRLKRESIKTDEYFQLASANQQFYDNNFQLLSQCGRLYFN